MRGRWDGTGSATVSCPHWRCAGEPDHRSRREFFRRDSSFVVITTKLQLNFTEPRRIWLPARRTCTHEGGEEEEEEEEELDFYLRSEGGGGGEICLF